MINGQVENSYEQVGPNGEIGGRVPHVWQVKQGEKGFQNYFIAPGGSDLDAQLQRNYKSSQVETKKTL